MRVLTFSSRNAKELLRDPLTPAFGLGFPIVLLLLFSAIQRSAPVPIFEISHIAPGMPVFSLSFITLFGALTVSRDRESAFLMRLCTTPLSIGEFLLGYAIPLLAMSLLFVAVPLLFSLFIGLKPTAGLLLVILFSIPHSIYSVSLGLLFGSILTNKQVGGICGALMTNLSAWFSGLWFDLDMVGGIFRKVAMFLPYYHAVEMEKAAYECSLEGLWPHLAVVLFYSLGTTLLSLYFFLKRMKER